MKIPESVRIGGTEYAVVRVEKLNDGEKVLAGQIAYDHTEIRVSADVSHEMACITLWHEMLHGLASRAGLRLGTGEEEVIDAFAYGVYQILQDNGGRLFDIETGIPATAETGERQATYE